MTGGGHSSAMSRRMLATTFAVLDASPTVNFRSLSDPLDTASSGGRLAMHKAPAFRRLASIRLMLPTRSRSDPALGKDEQLTP